MHSDKFKAELKKAEASINMFLQQLIDQSKDIQPDLREAISYTLQAGGKRIRPAVVLWCCKVLQGKENRNSLVAAAAIEMVHTYSLIHDDLPAMDNDDLRRGKPTCHKAFDEATAILAGDGLLTFAFEILAEKIDNPELAVKLISQLAQAAGPAGMIAGQMADLKAENIAIDEKMLEYIHINKTAKMFRCAAMMGALTGSANESQLIKLGDFGLKIGLGFQVSDDILDVSSTSGKLGKTAGKDVKAGKMTYPALMGVEKSRQLEKRLAQQAIELLDGFGKEADILRELTNALVRRAK